MLQEEIKVGHYYIHTMNGRSSVRKVISIDEQDKVKYQFMSGYKVKDGFPFNYSKLKNFANWATSEIEEKSDYSYLNGYVRWKKYTVLSVHGYELLKCQEKKVNFYVKNNVMKWVDENTLQFITDEIEKKIIAQHDGNLPGYMLEDTHACCVVCGDNGHLTKHHIIPKKDLKYYPIEVKRDISNLVAICRKHHTEYEIVKDKEKVSFEGFTLVTAVKWMNHFIETMEPKFLPKDWHVLTGLGRSKLNKTLTTSGSIS